MILPADEVQPNLLVAADHSPEIRLVIVALQLRHQRVAQQTTADAVVRAATTAPPDAVIVDEALAGPGLIARLRDAGVRAPVVLLDEHVRPEERLAAFQAGADRVVVKPFAIGEVVGAVDAVLRRLGRLPGSIAVGDLVLDPATGRAWLGGKPVVLPQLDFAVVCMLAISPLGRLPRRAVIEQLRRAGLGVIQPRSLARLPAVTGHGPGGQHAAVVRVSGSDLVLLDHA